MTISGDYTRAATLRPVSRINNLAQRYDRGGEFPEVIITNYYPQERKKWGPQQMDLFSAGLLGGETEDGGD